MSKPLLILLAEQPRLPEPGRMGPEDEAAEKAAHRREIVAAAESLQKQLSGAADLAVLFGFQAALLIERPEGAEPDPPPAKVEANPDWLDTIGGAGR